VTRPARRLTYDLDSSLPDARHRLSLLCFLSAGTTFSWAGETRAGYLRETQKMPSTKPARSHFEYKAGKVPDADYASLKTSLQDEAAAVLAEIAPPGKELRTAVQRTRL